MTERKMNGFIPSIEKGYKKTKMLLLCDYLHARRKYTILYAEELEMYKNLSNKAKKVQNYYGQMTCG